MSSWNGHYSFSCTKLSWSRIALKHRIKTEIIMTALWNTAGHYILVLWFHSFFFLLLSSFYPRLISAVADWMSTILLHMVWPQCEFSKQIWKVLHAARFKCRTEKIAKNRRQGTIAQLCRAISLQLKHASTIGKKLFQQQYVLHTTSQCSELQPTSGWDRSCSLRHHCLYVLWNSVLSVHCWVG